MKQLLSIVVHAAYLSANGFDISTRKLILAHYELLQVNIISESHARCVNLEDLPLSFQVWQGEFNL